MVLAITVCFQLLGAGVTAPPPSVHLVTATLWWGIAIAAITRLGLLAMTVGIGVYEGLAAAVLTTDLSAWYATGTIVAVMWPLLLAGYGAYTALAGRPIFAGAWLEE